MRRYQVNPKANEAFKLPQPLPRVADFGREQGGVGWAAPAASTEDESRLPEMLQAIKTIQPPMEAA